MMTPTTVDALTATVGRVVQSVTQLASLTKELSDTQEMQIKNIRRINLWLSVVLGILVLFAAFSSYQIQVVNKNSQNIAVLQAVMNTTTKRTAAEQQARRELVFCPLWVAMLSSYNPTSQAALANPAQYEDMFVALEHGAKYLNCSQQVRGPMTPATPTAPSAPHP